MRVLAIMIAAVALSGCGKGGDKSEAQAPITPAAISFDGAGSADRKSQIAHGERLSWIVGCQGCHGEGLRGRKWDDNPNEWGVMWAPNLTRSIPAMSDAQLTVLLTEGVHPTRHELWSMPSEWFQHLSPADLAALIAYTRSLAPVGEASPPPRPGPRAIAEQKAGTYQSAAVRVANYRDVLPADLGPRHALGRYITAVACTECHGERLDGQASPDGSTPNLTVAASYSRAAFELLTTRGEGSGGRKIHPLMQSVGKHRLSHLTPRERAALYDYLVARAARPQ